MIEHRCSTCHHSRENSRGIICCSLDWRPGWIKNAAFDCSRWLDIDAVKEKKLIVATDRTCRNCGKPATVYQRYYGHLCDDCRAKLDAGYTQSDAALMVGISQAMVAKYVVIGSLRSYRIGRAVRITRESIDALRKVRESYHRHWCVCGKTARVHIGGVGWRCPQCAAGFI